LNVSPQAPQPNFFNANRYYFTYLKVDEKIRWLNLMRTDNSEDEDYALVVGNINDILVLFLPIELLINE